MRPRGSRNASYDKRRAELLERLTLRLCNRETGWPTMRELAAAANCSVSTLSHYFGRREDVVRAVLHHIAVGTEDQLAATRMPEGPFEASVHAAAGRAAAALHQRELGGAGCNPLDAAAHATHVAEGFVAAYALR